METVFASPDCRWVLAYPASSISGLGIDDDEWWMYRKLKSKEAASPVAAGKQAAGAPFVHAVPRTPFDPLLH